MLSSDLDALEERLDGYEGPLKISLAGPWTLAATIELPKNLQPALSDAGAVADLTASLAEATRPTSPRTSPSVSPEPRSSSSSTSRR